MAIAGATATPRTDGFVDHGLLRLDEGVQVVRPFRDHYIPLIHADAPAQLLKELHGARTFRLSQTADL